MPDVPDPIVPSQYASTAERSKSGTDATHSLTASMSRSSIERPQCSPKRVQPIPTIATLSRIPLLAMDRPRLPEVVVHTLRRVHPAERQLNARAYRHLVGRAVGQLAAESTAAV